MRGPIMKSMKIVIAAAILLGLCGTVRAADDGFDIRRGFSSVARKATPAVVFIQVEKTVQVQGMMPFFNDPFDLFGGRMRGRQMRPMQPFKQSGQGSGFIISKDGYILTNTHVVGDADTITVKLADGRSFEAKRIGADPRTEVAVIKIEADDLPVLAIGDPEKLEIGEWVVAIGNPFGLKETLTVGVVSAKGRSNIVIADYEDFIQTDAAINPGNSGGPLLNIDGQVVGINTAIFSQSGGYMGIGFAVPIDMAMTVKSQLVKDGKVTRGFIGVMLNPGEVDEAMAKSFGLKQAGGVLLADVSEKGPADEAGLKAGDIVTAVDGAVVKDSVVFRRRIAQTAPGSSVELTVMRDGKALKKTVKVGTFPEDGAGVAAGGAAPADDRLEKLGFAVDVLSPELADRLGYEQSGGMVVTDVRQGSPAAEAGIQPGMRILKVNRAEIKSLQALRKAVADGGDLLLQVRDPEGGMRFILLRPPK